MDPNSNNQAPNTTQSFTPVEPSIVKPEATPLSAPTPLPAPIAAATQNPITITPEYRSKIYDELWKVMLEGLEGGKITVEQSEEISKYVLDHLDSVNSSTDLIAFLQELANKWPVYQSVLLRQQDESQKDEKIKELQENINQITNQS